MTSPRTSARGRGSESGRARPYWRKLTGGGLLHLGCGGKWAHGRVSGPFLDNSSSPLRPASEDLPDLGQRVPGQPSSTAGPRPPLPSCCASTEPRNLKMKRNNARATIRKFTISPREEAVGNILAVDDPLPVEVSLLTERMTTLINGMMISSLTSPNRRSCQNAALMITPTARSMTFPFKANDLNLVAPATPLSTERAISPSSRGPSPNSSCIPCPPERGTLQEDHASQRARRRERAADVGRPGHAPIFATSRTVQAIGRMSLMTRGRPTFHNSRRVRGKQQVSS